MNPRRGEHDQLRESMSRFAALLQTSCPTDQSALLNERMQFAQTFTAHLEREHDEVAELVSAEPKIRATFAYRHDMLSKLRSDYSAHVRHWTPVMIRSDWIAYRFAVQTLQGRLRSFMNWEESNLPIYR